MASKSMDYWRKFFSSGSSDIFLVIEKAILVAATDCPRELASGRDRIVETLYAHRRDPCSGFDLRAPVGKVNSSCDETVISCIEETEVLTDVVVKEENRVVLGEILKFKKKVSEERSMEERLEIAKRKLHEGYRQAENAKKQRTIKILEINEIPMERTKQQRKPDVKPRNNIRKMLKGWR